MTNKMDMEVKEIANMIAAEIKPIKIILFGSRAVGTAGPNSDIDLCVIKERVDSIPDEYIKARRSIKNTFLPIDMLFFDQVKFDKRKDIWGTVQYEIDKKGVVVYER